MYIGMKFLSFYISETSSIKVFPYILYDSPNVNDVAVEEESVFEYWFWLKRVILFDEEDWKFVSIDEGYEP